MIDWKKYVDQIYVLTYTTRTNNEFFYEELKRVGIYDSGIMFTFENIHTPFYKDLFNTFTNNDNNVKYTDIGFSNSDVHNNAEYSYVFDAAMAHYYCCKHAQQHNYNRILVLEDDLLFLKDVNQIQSILDNVYNEYSDGFVFLGNLLYDMKPEYKTVFQCNDHYDNGFEIFTFGTLYSGGAGFNIYDKTAYEYIIKFYENYMYAPLDLYLIVLEEPIKANIVKIYVPKTHIAIQYNWLFFSIFAPILYNVESVQKYKEDILSKFINFINDVSDNPIYVDEAPTLFNLIFNGINTYFFDNKLEAKDLNNLHIDI